MQEANAPVFINDVSLRNAIRPELRHIPIGSQYDLFEIPCERNIFLISGTVESLATSKTLTSGCTCWNFAKPPSSETQGPHHVDQMSNTAFFPRSDEGGTFSPVVLVKVKSGKGISTSAGL